MKKNDKMREAIINAGRKVFAHYGLEKATMEDVAGQLHVVKGALYYYFRSKQELFREVVHRDSAGIMKRIKDAVAGERSPGGKLRAYALAKVTCANSYAGFSRAMKNERLAGFELIRCARKQCEDEQLNLIKNILKEGVSRKVFSIKDMDLAAYAFHAQVKDLECQLILEMDEDSLKDTVEGLLDLFLNGVGRR